MLSTERASSGWLLSRLLPVGTVTGLGLGLIWSALPSWASEATTNAGDYTIENWQVEQGLPQISITSIAQTPDGYLWLGTFNGLVRFDGVRFTVFNEANTSGLGNRGVLRLMTDRQGALWIMTQGGELARFADGQFTGYGPERGLPRCGAAALVWDVEEHLLVVDRDGGLHRIENGQLVTADREEIRGGAESGLLVAPSEPCWIEKKGKAVRAASAPLRLPTTSGTNPPHVELTVSCATRRLGGGFWLAGTSGVYRLQNGLLQGPTTLIPEARRDLVAMAEDKQGNLWVGTWARGLFRWDPTGQWQRFSVGTGLAENDVTAIFVDREHNVWVGTGSGGLHRFKPMLIRTYDTRDGLSGNNIMSVTEDRQGRLWIGINGGGLNWRHDGHFAPVTEPLEVPRHRLVYSVLADHEDGVWIGLYGGLPLRLYAGALATYSSEQGFVQATPRALFEDQAGMIWLGCDRGLQRYDGGHFTSYTGQDGLAHDEVRALAQDRSGTLFIGTRGGGLNCFRNNRFSCYTARDGLPDNHVASLWVDREDTLWIGTDSGGLSRFRQGRFATITMDDGLPSNMVGTLLEDDAEHLWLGSNRGIVRVNRPELNDYLDGRRSTLTCRVFNRSDGLNGIDCSGGGQPACWKARDGKLWFATVKGLAVVDPVHLPVNSLPPPVEIEEVMLDDAAIASNVSNQRSESHGERRVAARNGNTLRAARNTGGPSCILLAGSVKNRPAQVILLPPGKHRLEFRFTGLSLIASEKVRFRYRLTGLDKDWIQAGSQRTASYNHVPPGDYRFEVRACNNDGVWNEKGATLKLVLLPPWWMTWWFSGLMVIGIAGLVFGWYERRLHRLRHERLAQESFSRQLIVSQENERQRIAGELHDDLGQDLLIIAGQAQMSFCQQENPPTTAARLKEIAETAKHALQQARRMAHNLRPGLVEELGFTKAVQATVDKAAQASGVSMVVNLVDVDGLLSPEFEVNLFRIIQECLNNILKHAAASEAKITLSKESACVRVVVEDNGCGFALSRIESGPPEQIGFGLRQIAERAKLMGGRLNIHSQAGQGTRLTVEVPFPRIKSGSTANKDEHKQ